MNKRDSKSLIIAIGGMAIFALDIFVYFTFKQSHFFNYLLFTEFIVFIVAWPVYRLKYALKNPSSVLPGSDPFATRSISDDCKETKKNVK